MAADPQLLRAWLAARSVARTLPEPVEDFGGLRVDTNSEKEARRWVFPAAVEGIGRLASSIHEPRHFIKLCGTAEELSAAVPPHWVVEDGRWFMMLEREPDASDKVPPGYRLLGSRSGPVSKVEIRTDCGELAASGFAAETANAFVYDRIETDVRHRQRGLARAVMAALESCRQSRSCRQVLMATAEGERLYSSIGWRKISPYSTACLPEN
jgi:GNAT superfamily N-acetyltransferase